MRQTHAGLVVTVLLVGLVAAAIGGATAAASPQPTPPENSTTTSAPTDGSERIVRAEIDSTTTLRSIEFRDGAFRLTIHSELPTRIVISDTLAPLKRNRGSDGMSTANIPQKAVNLQTGVTTVTFDADEWRGRAAITVAGSGGAVAINNGVPAGSPFAGSSGTVGWLGGASIVLLSFVGAAFWKLKNEGGNPVEATP